MSIAFGTYKKDLQSETDTGFNPDKLLTSLLTQLVCTDVTCLSYALFTTEMC